MSLLVHGNVSTDILTQYCPSAWLYTYGLKPICLHQKLPFCVMVYYFMFYLQITVPRANPRESFQHCRTQFIPEAKIRYLDYSLNRTD